MIFGLFENKKTTQMMISFLKKEKDITEVRGEWGLSDKWKVLPHVVLLSKKVSFRSWYEGFWICSCLWVQSFTKPLEKSVSHSQLVLSTS